MYRLHNRPTKRPLSEINVTPMVDIMLVLLVVFMVAAPLMHHTTDVSLPQTKSAPTSLEKESTFLSLKKDGQLFVKDTLLPIKALSAYLQKNCKTYAPVYLGADKDTPYGQVMQVMEAIDKGGYKVALVTEVN